MLSIVTDASLTKLSAAVVERPPNSDHMGIRLTAGEVLHRNFFIDLKKQKVKHNQSKIFVCLIHICVRVWTRRITWHYFKNKQNKNKRKVKSFYKNGVFNYIGLKANKVNAILTFDDNAC